jgi:hypothetical protein
LYIFLSTGSRPLWIPATREQFLRELIRAREADLAKDEAHVSPEGRVALTEARAALVDPLRSQLEGMSAGERASQAWVVHSSEVLPLVPANAEGARRSVVFNPDYFDRSRPRTDIQLISIMLFFGTPEKDVAPPFKDWPDVGKHRLWEFVKEVNGQQVAAGMD